MEKLKTIIVTQARVGSSRFPNKILKKIGKETLLAIHLRRLKKSQLADSIIVATTFEEGATEILQISEEEGVGSFQGSTSDVLDRFFQALKANPPEYVVRVTSDCPLIDGSLIDEVIYMVQSENLDYGSNTLSEEFPDGQDIEVFRWEALMNAWKEAKLESEREHVTPFIRKNVDFNGGKLFKAKNLYGPGNFNQIRMTVDEPSDLSAIKTLVANLGTDKSWIEYTEYIINHYKDFSNQKILRNEGYLNSLKRDLHS